MKIRQTLLAALVVSITLSGWLLRPGPAQDVNKNKTAIIDAAKFESLQAAFDAVPAGGGLVKLPPGTFEIKQPIVLSRAETRVEGSGAATHIINRNEEGSAAFIVRHAERATEKRKARLWRVQLADFRISGNPKSGDGLYAEGIDEIYLSGMSIDHHGGHGVNLVDCYEDPRVSDSILTYNKQAGLNIVAGHDIVVNANHFEENQDAVRCLDSFNLCMNGNNLDDHLRHGVVIENTYGSVVAGNMIEECNGTAVILDRDCYGITVSANVIAHNGGGVDIKDGWGCAISANTFTIVAARGLVVGPQAGRITITGNNFSNSYIGDKVKRKDAAAGIILTGTADITITGNSFTGLTGHAIKADDDCKRIVVLGNNAVDGWPVEGKKLPALSLGKAQPAVVEHNLIVD
ncbi:MAG: right-handed parallel beta-helix repeat-containing protein [Gemmataceae bacterium]